MKLSALALISGLISGLAACEQDTAIAFNPRKEAVQLQNACNSGTGEGRACSKLATFHSMGLLSGKGFGDPQDQSEATKYHLYAAQAYSKACDDGDSVSCSNLGHSYRAGLGVNKSISAALKYYGKACDLKDQNGCDFFTKLDTSESQ